MRNQFPNYFKGEVSTMNGLGSPGDEGQVRKHVENDSAKNSLNILSRRAWLKGAIGGGTGLAVSSLLSIGEVRAANKNLKLSNVNEYTTSCNFCSCGCGMIAAVREGKLIAMEGDFDHIVNRGSLCVKGISMFATHTSPNRLQRPRYRAPGGDHWQEISWEEAVDQVISFDHAIPQSHVISPGVVAQVPGPLGVQAVFPRSDARSREDASADNSVNLIPIPKPVTLLTTIPGAQILSCPTHRPISSGLATGKTFSMCTKQPPFTYVARATPSWRPRTLDAKLQLPTRS
jgi:hypothetical protein